MKKIRIASLILAVCLIFGVCAPSASALDEPRLKSADAVLVADMNTGSIIYSVQPEEYHSIASLTKIMTCLLAVEAVEQGRANLGDMVTAGDDCRQGLDISSSNGGISPGEEFTYQDLLYLALVHSANDACNVLASYLEGSISAFVEKMNQRAAQIGCINTHFVDDCGMLNRSEGHYSCPYDLYLITREAFNHPLFVEVCSTVEYTRSATNLRPAEEIYNTNALVSKDGLYGDTYLYDGVIGVKTGFTKPAGYCLVSTCKRGDVWVMCIVLGCNGVLTYTYAGEYQNFLDSQTLYDWTFQNFSNRIVFLKGEPLKRVDVLYAKGGATVALCPDEDLKLLMANEITDESITYDFHVPEESLVAPIEEGQVLGTVDVYVNGEQFSTVNVCADSAVEAEGKQMFKAKLHNFFSGGWLKTIGIILIIVAVLYIAFMAYVKMQRRKRLREKMERAERRRRERERMERQYEAQRPRQSDTRIESVFRDDDDDFYYK